MSKEVILHLPDKNIPVKKPDVKTDTASVIRILKSVS